MLSALTAVSVDVEYLPHARMSHLTGMWYKMITPRPNTITAKVVSQGTDQVNVLKNREIWPCKYADTREIWPCKCSETGKYIHVHVLKKGKLWLCTCAENIGTNWPWKCMENKRHIFSEKDGSHNFVNVTMSYCIWSLSTLSRQVYFKIDEILLNYVV